MALTTNARRIYTYLYYTTSNCADKDYCLVVSHSMIDTSRCSRYETREHFAFYFSLLSTYLYIYDACTFTRINVKISVHHASRFTDKNGILIFMVLCYEEILFRITPSTGTEGRVWGTEHFDVGPVRVLPARFPRLYTTLHLRSLKNCTIIRGRYSTMIVLNRRKRINE